VKQLFPPKSITLGITGSRDIPEGGLEIIKAQMAAYVANPRITKIIFGGARGADTEALRAALNSRTEEKPKLVVVVPMTVDRQPQETRYITRQADEVVELGLEYHDGVYIIRDRWIVENSNQLAAFWNGKEGSGTHKTMKIAEKSKKSVETWYIK
jgi:predicted Rossmann fold nucleotide-binding protein DprA/Smf involved in DNA uptake